MSATSSSCRFRAGKSMPLTSEDFPDPLTPVTTVITLSGNFTSMPCRLFILAPFMPMKRFQLRRLAGTGMRSSPSRYLMVWLSGYFFIVLLVIFCGSPSNTTLPPSRPASGPMSIRWSAERMMSSSCSTTTTVFPSACRSFSTLISLKVSRLCSPMLGSSRI